MNPAPPKPPSKNADRKALAAYWSELRRWAEALKNWEADLDHREAVLEAVIEDADDETVRRYAGAVSEEDEDEGCGCTVEDAKDGCECPTCMDWRQGQATAAKAKKAKESLGEEIKWLEDLWKLEDKRK